MAITNETIWITGASSGLGAALVEKLAPDNRLIISGRNKSALEKIANSWQSVDVLAFDMTDSQSIADISRQMKLLAPHLDRALLNAGTCEYFDITDPDWAMFQRVMDSNYMGTINCLRIALDSLKKSSHGHIVSVGSQAASAPFTRAQAYGSSKAALHYFMESMRIDLQQYNIDITLVKPGFIDTPLTRKNEFEMPFIMSAEKAAENIVAAMESRPLSYTFPWKLQGLLWMVRQLPRWWMGKQANTSPMATDKPMDEQ